MPSCANTLYIHPWSLDYWKEVYGYSPDRQTPFCIEFSCSDTPDPKKAAERELCHFNFFNLYGAKYILHEDSWDDEQTKAAFAAQLHLLEAGDIPYFISSLYYPADENSSSYRPMMECLGKGKTLLECVNDKGIAPYYAVINFREHSPLMPDRLCTLMEQFSTTWFGRQYRYEIPPAIIPSRESIADI